MSSTTQKGVASYLFLQSLRQIRTRANSPRIMAKQISQSQETFHKDLMNLSVSVGINKWQRFHTFSIAPFHPLKSRRLIPS